MGVSDTFPNGKREPQFSFLENGGHAKSQNFVAPFDFQGGVAVRFFGNQCGRVITVARFHLDGRVIATNVILAIDAIPMSVNSTTRAQSIAMAFSTDPKLGSASMFDVFAESPHCTPL